MEIGNHFLEGSVVTLKMPFIIVEKVQQDTTRENYDPDVIYQPIQGYVKKKIIFKTRGKPIGLKRSLPL